MPEKPHNQNLHPNFTDLPLYTGIDPEYTPPEPQRSLGERVSAHLESPALKKRMNRIGAAVAAGMLAATGVMVHNSMEDARQASDMVTADYAPENPSLQYAVVHAEEGIYSRNSPHTEDTPRIAGQGAYDGDTVQLLCGVTNGDAVGENSNNTWHKVKNLTRPDQPDFFLNDYYIASPNVADQLAPGEPECEEGSVPGYTAPQPGTGVGEALPPNPNPQPTQEEQKSCYFNFKWSKTNLTFSYEGNHRYYGNAWQAAKNWTDLNAGISITPAPEGQQGDIVFRDEFILQDNNGTGEFPGRRSWYGLTHVPDENAVMTSLPQNLNVQPIEIVLATPYVDQLDDFLKTYTLTHEMGHALGLAHPEACGVSVKTILAAGRKKLTEQRPDFNKPQDYDKIILERLYK